jgi:hypothetical protein
MPDRGPGLWSNPTPPGSPIDTRDGKAPHGCRTELYSPVTLAVLFPRGFRRGICASLLFGQSGRGGERDMKCARL